MKFKNIIIIILMGLFLVGCETELELDRNGNFVYQFISDEYKSSKDFAVTPDKAQELVHNNSCYKFIKQNSSFSIKESFFKNKYSFRLRGNIKKLKCKDIEEVRNGVYLITESLSSADLPSNAYIVNDDEKYIESVSKTNKSSIPSFIFSLNDKELNIYLRNNGLMKKSDKIALVNKKYRSLVKELVLEYDRNIEEYKSSVTIYDQYIGVKNWSKESRDSIADFKTKYSKFLNNRRENRLSSLSYDLSKIYETSKDMLYLVSKYHAEEIPSLAKDDYSFSDFALSSMNTITTLSKRKKLHEKSMDKINKYKKNLLKGY